MKGHRRLAFGVSALVASVMLGQASAFAQPAGSVAAGQYHNTSSQAGFNFFDQSTGTFVGLDVTTTMNSAAPLGGTPTTTTTTTINLSIFGNGTGSQGCYQIDPANFTLGSGSAALHTKVTDQTTNCNQPFQTGFPTPFTIDATWAANTPVTANRNDSQMTCGPYSLEQTNTSAIQGASAVLTITPLLSSTLTAPNFQFLRSTDQRQHAEGVQPDNCQPFPAIPGGAGPPPAGDYRTSSVMADFFVENPGDFRPSLEVDVTNMTQTSTPKDGPATSTTQFQVNITSTAGGNFQFGCFDLTPADFSNNGALGAVLSTKFTADTPKCFPFETVTLPLPLTVNVVWSGSGPVSTTHTVGDQTCLGYRNQGSGFDVTNNANVTATMPELLTDQVTATGTLLTLSGNNHAEGVLGPPCPI